MTRSQPDAPVTTGRRAPRFWNVPNSLTVGRLALAIVVFALISLQSYGWALALFILAAITDALDGYFARLLNQGTVLGRQLDPLIDKVVVCGVYVYLCAIPGTGVWPGMVAVIIIRELLIQGLRSHLEGLGQDFSAKMAGKLKTVFQCFSISAVLLVLSLPTPPPSALVLVRDILTWIAVLLTLWSGIGYIVSAIPRLRRDGEA